MKYKWDEQSLLIVNREEFTFMYGENNPYKIWDDLPDIEAENDEEREDLQRKLSYIYQDTCSMPLFSRNITHVLKDMHKVGIALNELNNPDTDILNKNNGDI